MNIPIDYTFLPQRSFKVARHINRFYESKVMKPICMFNSFSKTGNVYLTQKFLNKNFKKFLMKKDMAVGHPKSGLFLKV